MRDHLKLLGILNIVWSSFGIVLGLLVFLLFGGLTGFLAATGMTDSNSGGLFVAPFIAVIGAVVILVLCALSLPALIGGIGLLRLKSWSRPLMIVISVLHLFSFPIGTALGVYGLWVLFNPEAKLVLQPAEAMRYC